MSTLSTIEARKNFSELLNRSAYGKERITLTRRGKNLVAVVPIEDLKILEAIEDTLDLEEAKAALKESGAVPWKKVKAELGL